MGESNFQALAPHAVVRAEETVMRKWLRAIPAAALVFSLVFVAAQTSVAAQQKKAAKAATKKKSLYERLGKKDAITAVVAEFVSNVGADGRINQFFAKTDLEKLKMHLVNQICEASGGPCKYTGRSMKEAHQGMGVSGSDFNALVEDLVKALNKFNVGKTEQDELLGVLGGMKGDIVEKP